MFCSMTFCLKSALFSYTNIFVRTICHYAIAQRGNNAEDDSLSDRPEHASGGGCRGIIHIVLSLVQVSEPTCLCRRPLPRCFRGFGTFIHISVCTHQSRNTHIYVHTFIKHAYKHTFPAGMISGFFFYKTASHKHPD